MRRRLLAGALTAAAAGVGFLGTRPDSDWYRALDKPAWQPPNVAFPLVWTPLYGLIGWGTGRALEKAAPDDRRLLALTTADLAANAGWCWVFFAKQSPATGLGVILALDVLNIALLREAAKHDTAATLALKPYVVWSGFATALNASIWWRNRR
ncbi:tryptophan-rich sensory protein [Nocardioides hankookensis]|uniref:TspO/MBR family protein n=1 Tax=Nocardioides hankookensis TaxID=443157 RepID=A0ABW1LQV8_9ACTN